MTGKTTESEKLFDKPPAAAKGEVAASPVPSFNPGGEGKPEEEVAVKSEKKKPGPKPGFKKASKPGPKPKKVFGLKADGTPRKKPGPKPGAKKASKPGPKPVAKAKGKPGPKPGFKRKPGPAKKYNGAAGKIIAAARLKVKSLESELAKTTNYISEMEKFAAKAEELGL